MQARSFVRGGEASTSQHAACRPICRRPHRQSELRAATLDAPAQQQQQQQPFRQQHGRVFNFAAGPACLPAAVLEQAQAELLNWRGSGVSVMEMSHRGKEFTSILEQAVADLRDLLAIPANYQVFFVQGGGTGQFASVPLNLTKPGDTVDYLVTGSWSKKAAQEAGKYGLKVNVAAKGDNLSIPTPDTWKLSQDAAYVAYCDNETITGVEFKDTPPVSTDLVCDMSSNFCSKPVDVARYGVIYAGAQKNIGPSGVTIMVVRDDLLGRHRQETPSVLEYDTMKDSLFNTPPCFAIYMCGLVFAHMKAQGGVPAYYEANQRKAQLLYDAIEGSGGFYASPVNPKDRSQMNVPFTIPAGQDLEKAFISQATKEGMVQLKGHRSVGGMRASIYNAMPEEGVRKLVSFMKDFAASHQ